MNLKMNIIQRGLSGSDLIDLQGQGGASWRLPALHAGVTTNSLKLVVWSKRFFGHNRSFGIAGWTEAYFGAADFVSGLGSLPAPPVCSPDEAIFWRVLPPRGRLVLLL